jgi:hypothetical protein
MTPHPFGRLLAALLILFSVAAPLRAQGLDTGSATTTPWSGWWWPAKAGSLVLGYRGEAGPLAKQDQVTGKHSVVWEETQMYHFDPAGQDWWGHCHAWAAASILEPEPRHDVSRGSVVFHVGDIKGLLAEAHYSDRGIFYGQRFNGDPGDDLEDIYPLTLWSVLRKYLHDNKMPLIMDLNPGPQVWSYPAYQYSLSYWPIDSDTYQQTAAGALALEKRSRATPPPLSGSYQGLLSIWVGSFLVSPDTLGTTTEQHNYSFVFQAQGNQPIEGTDHWTGPSVQDHPDFAWYPTERAQENPDLDYNLVSQIDSQAH